MQGKEEVEKGGAPRSVASAPLVASASTRARATSDGAVVPHATTTDDYRRPPPLVEAIRGSPRRAGGRPEAYCLGKHFVTRDRRSAGDRWACNVECALENIRYALLYAKRPNEHGLKAINRVQSRILWGDQIAIVARGAMSTLDKVFKDASVKKVRVTVDLPL